MRKTFNLQQYLKKEALYQGSQEQMRAIRKKMDCEKRLRDKGLSASEAWDKCQELYDNEKGNGKSYLE